MASKERQQQSTKTADAPSSAPADVAGTTSSAVATRPSQTNAVSRQVAGYDVGAAGTGFEDFDQNDLAIPFIVILQKNSPQVEEDNPKYVKGAKAGMLMNTVTNELFDGKETGIIVVPVHRTRMFIEWIPKDDGGGLVAVYEPEAKEVKEALTKAGKKFGKIKINDNNDLVETFNVFAILVRPNGRMEKVVLGFASSQIGQYKKWMTTAQSIQEDHDGRLVTPPMFSHLYALKTFFFQKKEYTWYKWLPGFKGTDAASSKIPADSPVFAEAKQFREMVLAGVAKANFEGLQQEQHDEEDGGSTGYAM